MGLRAVAILACITSVPLLIPLDALAQEGRGAVMRFRGPRAAAVRSMVVSALSDQLALERRTEVEQTARRLGASLSTNAGRARVAEELGLDLLVTGRVRGRGARARIEVEVYDPRGELAASRQTGAPVGPRGRQELANAARDAVQEVLDALATPEPEPTPPPEPPPAPPLPPDPELSEGGQEGEPDDGSREGQLEPPLFAVRAGVGVAGRRAELRLSSGAKRVYESGAYPELLLELELRPLAGSKEAGRGLWVRAGGALEVGLSSSDEVTGAEVSTTAYRMGLELGYLLGIADDRVSIGPVLGFHYEAFVLSQNTVLPTSRYPQLRAGVLGRFELLPQVLVLEIGAAFRYAFSTGDLADSFGSNATAPGVDAGLRVVGTLEAGFTYAVGFDYRRYFLHFSGEAEDAPADDGHDEGLGASVTAGWALR